MDRSSTRYRPGRRTGAGLLSEGIALTACRPCAFDCRRHESSWGLDPSCSPPMCHRVPTPSRSSQRPCWPPGRRRPPVDRHQPQRAPRHRTVPAASHHSSSRVRAPSSDRAGSAAEQLPSDSTSGGSPSGGSACVSVAAIRRANHHADPPAGGGGSEQWAYGAVAVSMCSSRACCALGTGR